VKGAVWTYHTTADAAGTLQTVDAAVDTRSVRRSAFRMVTSVAGGSFPVDWRCTRAGLVQRNLGDLTPGAAPSLFRVTDESGVTVPSADLRRLRWTQVYVLAGALATAGGRAVYAGRAVIRYTGGDGKESVTVPAGTYPDSVTVYSDMVAHLSVTVQGRRVPFALEVEKHAWYVRGVGVVKQITDANIGFAHIQITMLLSDVTGLGLSQ
jgi:hypothetical protein